ncbi:hypothetical protein DID99_31840 [Burkholderia sp. Bp8986]|nr:hypothetical protein DIE10_33735 [Burkholderia sp. Bp9011]RQR84247.1 hypothetical protein DIE09_34195 [Burkholderia sp. Bp9010]RQS46647.1 hypothetical protein DID99_31840 [Burkholderia sp. Bp8986]RQS52000.1 hypothetical protein DID98_32015 [Burkholderia sp. Bp8984]RQS65422.1 hypothetical protein DID97_32410 [Burkholderia sp. Bp8977]
MPQSGISWKMLPQETGCGSGMSCWRRPRDWQQPGCTTSGDCTSGSSASRRSTKRS